MKILPVLTIFGYTELIFWLQMLLFEDVRLCHPTCLWIWLTP